MFDLTQTLRTQASAFHNLTLLVPRPYMEAAVEGVAALHGLVLSGQNALTELLAEHLSALAARVPRRLQFGLTPTDTRDRADRIWVAHAWADRQSDPMREFMLWMRTLREAY